MVGELIVTTRKRDGGGFSRTDWTMFDLKYDISFP